MGQRLNIEIKENGNVLANAYYHWSGYTSSSLGITQEILNNIDYCKCDDKTIYAIRLLERTGAGLTDDEKQCAKENIINYDTYTFAECTGRNDGLIAISPQGIQTTEYWEEARVEINIDTKTVNFKAIWIYTREEIEQDYDDIDFDAIPTYDIDFANIPFEKFEEINSLVEDLIKKEIYKIKLINSDKIYWFIE